MTLLIVPALCICGHRPDVVHQDQVAYVYCGHCDRFTTPTATIAEALQNWAEYMTYAAKEAAGKGGVSQNRNHDLNAP